MGCLSSKISDDAPPWIAVAASSVNGIRLLDGVAHMAGVCFHSAMYGAGAGNARVGRTFFTGAAATGSGFLGGIASTKTKWLKMAEKVHCVIQSSQAQHGMGGGGGAQLQFVGAGPTAFRGR